MGKQARTASRTRRAAALAAATHRRRVHRLVAGVGGLVIVGLLIAIVVSLISAAGKGKTEVPTASSKPLVAPATATATGAIAIGRTDAPVRLEIYLDYMCPYCGRFERANGGEIQRMVADGSVRLELHPLSFLDKTSQGTRYSTRAANAVATTADRAPDKVLALSNALYGRQPAEGSAGRSDDELATLGSTSGVPQEVVDTFRHGDFETWVATSTDSAFKSGITGTPTVKINGTVFTEDLYTIGPLTRAVEAATGR
jgi:protein-disulfide isomerase